MIIRNLPCILMLVLILDESTLFSSVVFKSKLKQFGQFGCWYAQRYWLKFCHLRLFASLITPSGLRPTDFLNSEREKKKKRKSNTDKWRKKCQTQF